MVVANAWAAAGHATVRIPPSRPSLSSSSSASFVNFPNILFLKNSKNSRLCCRCVNVNSTSSTPSADENCNNSCFATSSSDWDWNRWTRYFSEIEQAESYASVLKFQLEEAIEKEDFEEAAKLKAAIAEATAKDSVAEIMSMLKNAIDEERYHDASRLCRSTGSGLVGWWAGYSKDSDDPFGRLIRITPGVGRFIGRSYSPRQLVKASPGTPLFEIFVVKDGNNTYNLQVVFMQRTKGSAASSSPSSESKPMKGPATAEIENKAVIDVKIDEAEAEKSNEKSIDFEGAAEEGIRSVINFLKDKIPDLKVKVMKVNITEEITDDGDSVKQFLEGEDENTISSEEAEETTSDLDDINPDRVIIGGDSGTSEDGKTVDTKLFLGGILHNKEDNPVKDEFVRLPAEIKDVERDSFMLHIPKRPGDQDGEEHTASSINIAAIEAQGVSELMPPDVAKAFWSSDKVSSKVSRNVKEILKLAVSQAQKRYRLSEYTNFSRITTSPGDLDPFEGLYVGAFGPYGTEVVQLRRKYGNWNVNDAEKSSDVEFFEYVEAVKLTGDINVPAGQVTFRAKIGKASRLTNRGMYPDELGVVASYKGQGRIAEFGFKNPRWVEGELLQLNGKGMGPHMKGADLGFLYVIPEHSFLVLFNRVKLPE
ncbi:PREDICTED: protein EXECUTER 2, chloroplastic [Nicotiana attenuata]|uniref:Protein executer 2, chloroplastic n=1 Tax=Nicotiana attenuata TaxID=49451 RepID=A0A1J6IPP4_NICAT|nr:PREDICTED: protein EXECUTER 2, chloroplastic [Nicotiana attenuata]OIT02544.1 protein executer 2, chloroplastic [Nicotiana attenuata]